MKLLTFYGSIFRWVKINTEPGKGIRLELKSNQNKYIIASKNIDEIKKILIDIHSLASDKKNKFISEKI